MRRKFLDEKRKRREENRMKKKRIERREKEKGRKKLLCTTQQNIKKKIAPSHFKIFNCFFIQIFFERFRIVIVHCIKDFFFLWKREKEKEERERGKRKREEFVNKEEKNSLLLNKN